MATDKNKSSATPKSKGNGGGFSSLEQIHQSEMRADDKVAAISALFKASSRYKRLAKKLSKDDLEWFCEQWSVYSYELEDLNAAEEDMLEVMIMIKIRIDDNMAQQKQIKDREESIRKQLNLGPNEEIDIGNETHRALFEMIQSNNRMALELNKDFKELSIQYDKVSRSMNTTREQRESYENIGADSFLTLIKQFNDRDIRKQSGRYNELMKMATKQKTEEFKEPYVFVDFHEQPILLDGQDYKKAENA